MPALSVLGLEPKGGPSLSGGTGARLLGPPGWHESAVPPAALQPVVDAVGRGNIVGMWSAIVLL